MLLILIIYVVTLPLVLTNIVRSLYCVYCNDYGADLEDSLHYSVDLEDSLHYSVDLEDSLHYGADLEDSLHYGADLDDSRHCGGCASMREGSERVESPGTYVTE